ncbi:MAG: amino acid ABC transporter substrate-binding protein [Candidatus Rokuibacteriota bacterium]
MKQGGRPSLAVIAIALCVGSASVGEAQKPIRIGTSASTTGTYAALGQNQLRGYQLCVKHTNDKGGLLGRKLELVVDDDQSQPATATAIYERLITPEKVDLLLGPYGTPMTQPVADIPDKYKMPMISPTAAAASIFKQGRKFIFMMSSPQAAYFEGAVDLAARNGLKTMVAIHHPVLRGNAVGAAELAKKKGLEVLFVEEYPAGTTDFTPILTRVRAANPDLLAAATFYEDSVAVTRHLKALSVNARMFVATVGVSLPTFYETLGRDAEFVYGASQWEPELVTLRAGGLIPIARQYPGAREFVDSYRKEFPGADLSYHSASGYGACEVLVEAVRRAGSLGGAKVRETILKADLNTVYGGFKVDADGFQIAHKMVTFQWQDGKKVIVRPDELAPGKPRFPTPPWSQRQ